MTIGKKLYLLMGAAIAGLVLISLMLVRDIGNVYTSANYGNENTVPSLKVLADMTQRWSSMRISTWQHVAIKDPATDTAMEAKYNENSAKLDEAVAAYAPLLSDDKDKAIYEFEKSELAYYRSLAQQAFELSRAGRKAEAADLLMASQPRTAALIAKMSEHRDYNEVLGKTAAEEAAATRAKSIRNGTLIVALVAILLCAGSFLVIRSIRGGLARVIGHFHEIEAGNLGEAIEVTSSDEIGRVLAALRDTQQALRDAAQKVEAASVKAADDDGQLAAVSKAMAVIEFDLDGSVRAANDNFLALLGYKLAEIKGRHHSLFIDPAERDSADYRQFWDRLRRGEYVAGRFRHLGQGNREVWIQASYNPILDVGGKPYKVVNYATDVTQQVLMSQQLETAVRETQGVVTTAVEGNLVARIPMDGKSGDLGRLCGGVNTLLDAVSTLVEQVQGAAGEVHAGAEEISRGNVNLSQRTEEQASSLEETASSMEEMTSTVKQTADNAGQANQLAMAARQQAEKGGAVVGAAVTAMSQINASSKKIADIIGVIDEIAFQTNLLALNAAVEAARAGEQGRGFAVVASEVRNLAGRSAAAAKEIKALINDSVVKVEEGSRLVDDSGRALGEIVTSVKKVTDIVSEIAAGTQEQSSGIEQVNKAVMQMDEATQQNAALVEQAAAASQAIVDQAQALNALVARYTVSAAAKPARPAQAPSRPPERRSASRPWNPAPGAKSARKAAPAAAEAAPRRAAAGGGQSTDADWESF